MRHFKFLILQTFNFTVDEMSNGEVLRVKEKKDRGEGSSVGSRREEGGGDEEDEEDEEANYPCGEAELRGSGAPRLPVLRPITLPVSSLCVNQNFICGLEGKDSLCLCRIGNNNNNNNNLQPKRASKPQDGDKN